MKIALRHQNLDKNPNLKPTKKIWSGGIDFPQTNNIDNDPETILNGDLFSWKGQKLSQDYLRTIDEDARDEIAKDIYNFLQKYNFDKFTFAKAEVDQGWKALVKFKPTLSIVDGVTHVSNSSTSGNKVYRNFFPNIIKINGDNRPSIYDVLTDKVKLWDVVRNRIGNTLLYNDDTINGIPVQYPMNMSLSQITIGAKNSGLASMGSIFKPSVAKAIYDKYVKAGDNVLDYSCGFGSRLLGLMSLNRGVKYCGYEPNTETYDNLIKMINYFKFDAEIKKSGSETDDLFENKFNFAFSSPPYFSMERYSEEDSQCYNKYPEYERWLELFWRKTVLNIKSMLADDGVFGINIGGNSNELMLRLEKDMTELIEAEGFKLVDRWNMVTSKSHLAGKKGKEDKKSKLEGIFFYKKL